MIIINIIAYTFTAAGIAVLLIGWAVNSESKMIVKRNNNIKC